MSRREPKVEVQNSAEEKVIETAVFLPEKVEAAPEEKAVETSPVETLIYVGRSLPQGALQQYSVFKNGVPVMLKESIDQCPAIAHLMVPISKLNETKSNLSITGTREHALDQQIQSYVRGAK